mmetsp:Transcript_58738/g.135456  ORF Transcript_58738/g.135456 Transcript_58738/m.135456 type:complete len:1192 (+) Transcript_58738:255-3830(+)
MLPGSYSFALSTTTPAERYALTVDASQPCGVSACWVFEARADVFSVGGVDLDRSAAAVGFPVHGLMPAASLAPLNQRNDRPGQLNRLLFTFRVGRAPSQTEVMTVRGPLGFVFNELCTGDANIDTTDLSPDFAVWPASAGGGSIVEKCSGFESVAEITLSSGLRPGNLYALELAVTNPTLTPFPNQWLIEYAQESSAPFDGFPLGSFTGVEVIPAIPSVSDPDNPVRNPVAIRFRPARTSAGMLAIDLPDGFIAVLSEGACLASVEQAHFTGEQVVKWPTEVVACEVELNQVKLTFAEGKASYQWESGRLHTIEILVANPEVAQPASQWAMHTFNVGGEILDSFEFPGFAVYQGMALTVTSSGSDIPSRGDLPTASGDADLEDIRVSMTFPDDIQNLDILTVLAPEGVVLQSGSTQECRGYSWDTTVSFTASTAYACVGSQLQITVAGTHPAESPLDLLVSARTPSVTPSTALNFWRATHARGASVLSSNATTSFVIVPQMRDVGFSFVPGLSRAGSLGTLVINFVPMSSASLLRVEALDVEAGFDFSQSITDPTVTAGLVTSVTEVSCEISFQTAPLQAGIAVSMPLETVTFGTPGGPFTFRLTTEENDVVADATILSHYFPGSVDVLNASFLNNYADAAAYPVRGTLRAQTGTLGQAVFVLKVTKATPAETQLVVRCPGYVLQRVGWELVRREDGEPLRATVLSAGVGEAVVRMDQGLATGVEYEVRVPAVSAGSYALTQKWTLEFLDGEQVVDTNDGATSALQISARYGLLVEAERTPPLTIIEALVTIDVGTTTPSVLYLFAPPGYNFSQQCLMIGAGMVASCAPGEPAGAGGRERQVAVLSAAATTLSGRFTITLSVLTPAFAPALAADLAWIVQGIGAIGATTGTLGWGEDTVGLTMRQMPASVAYAAVANVTTDLVVAFESTERLQNRGRVTVMVPEDFQVLCTGVLLKELSLPGVVECRVFPGQFTVVIRDALLPGEYTFAVRVVVPPTTPVDNEFSVILKNREDVVRDARAGIPGQTVSQMGVEVLPLKWTTSQAGDTTRITLSVEVTADIRSRALLITPPKTVFHRVTEVGDVAVAPTASAVVGVVAEDVSYLRLDLASGLTRGLWTFEFEARLPASMPSFNVWQVGFCDTSCTTHDDSLTFSVAGFQLGEASEDRVTTMAGAGASGVAMALGLGLLSALW